MHFKTDILSEYGKTLKKLQEIIKSSLDKFPKINVT